MKKAIALLLALNFNTPAMSQGYVEAAPAQMIKGKEESKDQKFIANNSICLISKKEQDEATDYIISSEDNSNAQQKLALTILQLRVINNNKFNDINCALRFFLEKFYDKNGRRWSGDYGDRSSPVVSEYLKILERLRTDPKFKIDFEKTILNSSELSYYYGVLGNNISDYNLLEPGLARKFFSSSLINKGNNRQIGQDEWQLLFDLFYTKNILPPKELNDFLKSILMKPHGFVTNSQLMTVYLNNANEMAYNDLFKSVFENLNPNNAGMGLDHQGANPSLAKNIFISKFLPDTFKCNYARDSVAKNAPKFPKEAIEDLKKMNISCLNEALVDASKFTYPVDGCPQILLGKNEDQQRLLSKMSGDFSRNWLECRKKCSTGDKCLAIQDNSGIYSFLNGKFEKDLPLFKDIQMRNFGGSGMMMSLKYDYKPVGVCTEKGTCGEKIGCADTEINKKINEELKAAKYQSCKADNDCYILATGFAGCTEYPINVNLMPAMAPAPAAPATNNPRRFFQPGMPNFLTSRLSKISEQCGKPYSGWECRRETSSQVKCEKNLCVITK